jgi:hypothetical protein
MWIACSDLTMGLQAHPADILPQLDACGVRARNEGQKARMKKRCECCDQPGELALFPPPVPADSVSEILMCEACRNGDALERFLEFVMVPAGIIKKTGKTRDGKNVYRAVHRDN